MSLGHGNKFFSSLDMLSGYWQVPLAPESKEITAFSTPNGHFEWLCMLFGLKSAPTTFQRMINHLFSGTLGKGVYAYLDDLLICGKDIDSHLINLETVLRTLQEAGLKAKLAKCEFLKAQISFLGHKEDGDGIHTMDDKIAAIKNFPRPKTVENVRSFVGLCSYYRSFIDSFSKMASPLTPSQEGCVLSLGFSSREGLSRLKGSANECPCISLPGLQSPIYPLHRCLSSWCWCCPHATQRSWQAPPYRICESYAHLSRV